MNKAKVLSKLANGTQAQQKEAKEQIAPTPPDVVEGFTFGKNDVVMIDALLGLGWTKDEFQPFPQDETKWFLPL